jgi:cobalt/nickel transport system permease protein/cobalt/nickel transport protein
MIFRKSIHHEGHETLKVKNPGRSQLRPLRALCVLRGARGWVLSLACLVVLASPTLAEEQKKWPGVDETVVEKYAKELGREARDPYINTDQGDLLLFLFALAGATGGFICGYYWHKLFVAGKKKETPDAP